MNGKQFTDSRINPNKDSDMGRNILMIFFILAAVKSFSQNSTIDGYINLGLESNLGLKQKSLNLAQSFQYLQLAKGMFYPTLKFQSDYTYAAGGRNIILPLGDLFNPAFNSLNQLTGTNDFQQVANQEFNLSANDYFDNRLVVNLTLVNAELFINKSIKKEAITQQQAEVAVYKRGLVREIKIAYYNIITIQKQIEIFKNADKLLQDNYKITLSRVKNGKVLQGNALRILSDVNDNKAKLADFENQLKTASAYLNFLTNEKLASEVKIDTAGFRQIIDQNIFSENIKNEREEIAAFKSSLRQANLTANLRKSAYLPVINTFINGGYQSTYLKFDTDSRYLAGGVSMKWDLFSGFQNKNKIKVAKTDVAIWETKIDETAKQFEYQQQVSENELATAQAQRSSSLQNLAFLEEYYRETKSRYDQGMVLLLEINDAFTQLINGRIKFELANTAVLNKIAEVERTTAAYPINQ